MRGNRGEKSGLIPDDCHVDQVMSMNAPANPQSIQRFSEGEEEEVQRSPLAASITPLIQRFSGDVQTKSSVQRAGESGASQAGASLESRLSSQRRTKSGKERR